MIKKSSLSIIGCVSLLCLGLCLILMYDTGGSLQTAEQHLSSRGVSTSSCIKKPHVIFNEVELFAICDQWSYNNSEYQMLYVLDTSGQISLDREKRSNEWNRAVSSFARSRMQRRDPGGMFLFECFKATKVIEDIYYVQFLSTKCSIGVTVTGAITPLLHL
jgi:hypothetical protein